MLDKDGVIEDPCLVRPMAVRALLDAAVAEREAVRALQQRGSPEIAAIKEQGREEGRHEGREEGRHEGREEGRIEERRAMVAKLVQLRLGEIPEAIQAKIAAASGEALAGWLEKLLTAASLEAVFGRE
jgi:flagellar biosynthesis/type III secretory pathway protein FliH